MKSSYYYIFVSFLALALLIMYNNSASQKVFASSSSPSFSLQEIDDNKSDWIDVWRGRSTTGGDKFTDIQVVNYYSDGRFLNATLWLDKFNGTGPSDRELNYGMYIDADFNNKTGIAGIDYRIAIQWNSQSKSWTRVFQEWSTNGKTKTVDIQPNYGGFFERDVKNIGNNQLGQGGGDYVTLNADLSKMSSPYRYKVLFYAEEVKGLNWIMDSSKWVYVPPPKFVITMLPQTVDLRQAETKTVEVQVNSTNGFEPSAQLYGLSPSPYPSARSLISQQHLKQRVNASYASTADTDAISSSNIDIKLDFKFNNFSIPSLGEATTPLTISSTPDALVSPHTLFIVGNFTFPSEDFYFGQPSRLVFNKIKIPTENVISRSSLIVRMEQGLTPIDQVSELWTKLGGFINFVYAIGGAAATWLFTNYIKKTKNEDKKNDSSEQHR
jgi:hypothetical protein